MEGFYSVAPHTDQDSGNEHSHHYLQFSQRNHRRRRRKKNNLIPTPRWLVQTFQHPLVLFISAFVYLFILSPLPVRCQNDIDLCNATNSALCVNNSTCEDRGHDFKCRCAGTDFTGWYCNITARQNCSPGVCLNGGTCSNTTITAGANSSIQSFNCTCQPGYEGPLCEKAIDYCNKDGRMCANNGQCVNHPEYQNYTCSCASGFSGVNCTETVSNCSLNCSHGVCSPSGNSFTCLCHQGYTGSDCSSVLDNCLNGSYCQHATCLENKCDCTGSGWKGDGCETNLNECTANTTVPRCLHDGDCTDLEGSYHCNCTLGYEGDRCEIVNCSAVECQNGGSCDDVGSEWICRCPPYVEGDLCQTRGPCYSKPCNVSNTLTCSQSVEFNNYTCTCKEGWKGQNCTENIDECSEGTDKCVNGTCRDIPGSYTCLCVPGFTGQYCDIDIDDCASQPCEHGGKCSDGINKFICDCTGTGYQGVSCSEDVNECQENSSVCNQGDCQNTNGSYECHCREMYLGDHCEVKNPCHNNTSCLNEGVCVVNKTGDGSYLDHCNCKAGFQGVKCEKSPSTSSDDTDLGVIIGPIVGGVLFIIIVIVIIAFVMTARSKRATRGAYSPSQQETSGSRVELGNVLKKPPEERLI